MLPKPQDEVYRGLNVDEMRELVRAGLGGVSPSELDNTKVDQLLNMSFWYLESRFPFKEKECRIEFPMTVGENGYLVPGNNPSAPNLLDLEAIKSISVIDPDSDTITQVSKMTQQHWDAIVENLDNTDYYAIPTRWVRMDETIVFHPTPDKIYTVRLYFLKTLKSLVDGTVDDLNFPREWCEIVVEGAIARGHQYYGQDYNLAGGMYNLQTNKIRTAVSHQSKEESPSRYARLIVQWDEPEGVYD
jgi:hypothetical protein